MYFKLYWMRALLVLGMAGLLAAAIIGISSLESFYQKLFVAQLPAQILTGIIYAGTFVFMYTVVMRGGFAKLHTSNVKGKQVDVNWNDVIGMDEVKEEAWEVVQLIKDRTKIKKIGGKIIKGILLVGPPGCGKTYLAKAIATESGVPFLAMTASEFTEIFVGVGASRVRAVFKKAKALAYGYGACIIFIDELDAVGRKRAFSVFGGTEETNSTQNQLLSELDGLKEKDSNVIVIGATNALEDILDTALLRPGRFDRKIYVDRPNLQEREKIFKYYLSKIRYDESVDVGRLARKAVYKTPADISNIIKEAALISLRNKKEVVTLRDISEAIERIDMGIKHKRHMTEKERKTVACHETGHLMTLYFLHPTDDVFKASIVSRKDALGVVHHQPREEIYTSNKERMLANIKVSLGGYVAEKMVFGTTSDGVSMDFKLVMKYAHDMVWKYGMGTNGFLGDYTMVPDGQLSEAVKQNLSEEVSKIIKECMQSVEELLTRERAIFDRFVNELLTKEELDYDEIEAIFKEYGKENQRSVA